MSEAAALTEQIAELLAEHRERHPAFMVIGCTCGWREKWEPDDYGPHLRHVASILAARLADSRPNDLQAEVNLWIEREQETHARYLRVSDEVTGLYEGVRAVMASAADSDLREPVGGHPVVTVDWLTGRLSDVLSNPDRLADSRPVVSEAAIRACAIHLFTVNRDRKGRGLVDWMYASDYEKDFFTAEAKAALTAALPHMGNGKGEADHTDLLGTSVTQAIIEAENGNA